MVIGSIPIFWTKRGDVVEWLRYLAVYQVVRVQFPPSSPIAEEVLIVAYLPSKQMERVQIPLSAPCAVKVLEVTYMLAKHEKGVQLSLTAPMSLCPGVPILDMGGHMGMPWSVNGRLPALYPVGLILQTCRE